MQTKQRAKFQWSNECKFIPMYVFVFFVLWRLYVFVLFVQQEHILIETKTDNTKSSFSVAISWIYIESGRVFLLFFTSKEENEEAEMRERDEMATKQKEDKRKTQIQNLYIWCIEISGQKQYINRS